MITEAIITMLIERRKEQDEKWGPILTRTGLPWPVWCTILSEEVGEVAQAILKRDRANLLDELLDVGAVCIAMLELLMPTVEVGPEWR